MLLKISQPHVVSLRVCRRHTCHRALSCAVTNEPLQASARRDTAAPFVNVMKGMTSQALLAFLGENGVPVAQELQQEREDLLREQREQEEARQFQAASRAALKDAAVFGRTNEGRQIFQTILTAHAYDVGKGPSTLPGYRKAEILGVHLAIFWAARQREKSPQPALQPCSSAEGWSVLASRPTPEERRHPTGAGKAHDGLLAQRCGIAPDGELC